MKILTRRKQHYKKIMINYFKILKNLEINTQNQKLIIKIKTNSINKNFKNTMVLFIKLIMKINKPNKKLNNTQKKSNSIKT